MEPEIATSLTVAKDFSKKRHLDKKERGLNLKHKTGSLRSFSSWARFLLSSGRIALENF